MIFPVLQLPTVAGTPISIPTSYVPAHLPTSVTPSTCLNSHFKLRYAFCNRPCLRSLYCALQALHLVWMINHATDSNSLKYTQRQCCSELKIMVERRPPHDIITTLPG